MENFTDGQFVDERELESIYIDGKPFRIELYISGKPNSQRGRFNLAYRLYHGDEKIFEGLDYSPSPLFEWDSDECFGALLSFLSLQPGDTDDEYFEDYTPEQLAWAEEHGEELSFIAMELEEGAEG